MQKHDKVFAKVLVTCTYVNRKAGPLLCTPTVIGTFARPGKSSKGEEVRQGGDEEGSADQSLERSSIGCNSTCGIPTPFLG